MEISTDFFKSKTFKLIILSIVCFAFYGNTISNGYTLDDGLVISDNQFVKKGVNGIHEIFTHDSFYGCIGENVKLLSGGRYRPLSLLTFAIEFQIFGLNPHISHFVNILFLVLIVILLFKLLDKLFSQYLKQNGFLDFAFITTLLFIVHPVHTEAIANIKGRDELMALAGSLSAALLILKYIDSNRFGYLVFGFIAFFLALLSKENSVSFVAIIPLSIYFYKNVKWYKYLLSSAPLIIACILFFILRKTALGEIGQPPDELLNNPFLNAEILERYATILYTLGMYIKLLFWPHPLTYDYYPWHIGLMNRNSAYVIISLFIYISIITYALFKLTKKSIVSFGILFYIITLSPVSNIFIQVGTFMSERFIFMPSIGFLIIIGWLWHTKVSPFIRLNYLRIAILTTLLLFCFVKTYSRNKVWKDNFTLFTTDVKTSVNSIKGNMAAGRALLYEASQINDESLKKEYFAKALRYSKKAVSIYPNHVDIVTLMADAYAANNISDTAIFYYQNALYLMPDRADLIFDRVEKIMNKMNDIDFIINNYYEFWKLAPDNFNFNFQFGSLLGEYKNDFVNADYYLQRAVKIRPDDFRANMILGINNKLLGKYDKSYFYLEKALKMEPYNMQICENLLIAYKLAGNTKKAQEIGEKLKALKKTQK